VIPRLVNAALGIWLMAAPAVLGYSTTGSAAGSVDRTVGPLVASTAIAAIWPEIRPLRWVNVVLGGWMVVAPLVLGWFVDYPTVAVVNSIVVGAAVTGAAFVRGPVDARFGGGWRSVWRSDIDTTGR
jgi:hypothetical protein